MTGKQKCKILRQIRRDIAAANHLDYTERDCTHQGDCAGTCPYCEAQLKRLEGELETRRSLGQRIAVMGLSMGLLAVNLTACDDWLSRGRTTQGVIVDTEPDTAQTEVTDSIPGELVAAETTQGEPVIDGGMPIPETDVVTTMGDIVLPETEPPMPTMGVLPAPETVTP